MHHISRNKNNNNSQNGSGWNCLNENKGIVFDFLCSDLPFFPLTGITHIVS